MIFARSVLFKGGHKLVDIAVSEIYCFNNTIFCEGMVKCSTHEAKTEGKIVSKTFDQIQKVLMNHFVNI